MKKTVVLTGATGGIGKALATDFAKRGYKLVMPCRSLDKAEALRSSIRVHSPHAELDFIPCNLNDFSSVARCGQTILSRHPVIDIVVANAATVEPELAFNAQGIEKTFAVNHLAHFILMSWLLERLYVHSRIIFVSSSSARRGQARFINDVNYQQGGYHYFQAYANSKFANVACARVYARLLKTRQIACTSVHPGLIATNIWPTNNMWQRVVIPLLKTLYFSTAEKGAKPIMSLAVGLQHNEQVGHFDGFTAIDAPANVQPDFEKALWQLSLELCKPYLAKPQQLHIN